MLRIFIVFNLVILCPSECWFRHPSRVTRENLICLIRVPNQLLLRIQNRCRDGSCFQKKKKKKRCMNTWSVQLRPFVNKFIVIRNDKRQFISHCFLSSPQKTAFVPNWLRIYVCAFTCPTQPAALPRSAYRWRKGNGFSWSKQMSSRPERNRWQIPFPTLPQMTPCSSGCSGCRGGNMASTYILHPIRRLLPSSQHTKQQPIVPFSCLACEFPSRQRTRFFKRNYMKDIKM